jgi:Tfp pilus assembly protein PilO
MSWLPKDRQKRNQLFFTLGGAIILLGAIVFGLIRPQYAKLSNIKNETANAKEHLKTVEHAIQQSDAMASQLANVTYDLSSAEEDMASGDIYAWTIDTIRHFKSDYKVDVLEIGQPSVSDVDLLPRFPYKQLKFTLRGTGYYHDIGKFIADFENRFPHMRVVNLDLEPTGTGGDSEKLWFRMDIIALVKSNVS